MAQCSGTTTTFFVLFAPSIQNVKYQLSIFEVKRKIEQERHFLGWIMFPLVCTLVVKTHSSFSTRNIPSVIWFIRATLVVVIENGRRRVFQCWTHSPFSFTNSKVAVINHTECNVVKIRYRRILSNWWISGYFNYISAPDILPPFHSINRQPSVSRSRKTAGRDALILKAPGGGNDERERRAGKLPRSKQGLENDVWFGEWWWKVCETWENQGNSEVKFNSGKSE